MAYLTAAAAVPADTIRAARASFGSSNPYIILGDRLSEHVDVAARRDHGHADNGQPTAYPSLPALITIFQFKEGLNDRQAVEAIRTRLDWKYALHLPLNLPDVPVDRLCAERQRLLKDPAAEEDFQALLSWLASVGFIDASTEIAADDLVLAVCCLSRTSRIMALFCQALEALAAQQGEWLGAVALPHWYFWYAGGFDTTPPPSNWGAGNDFTRDIGLDVRYLLEMCAHPAQADIIALPAIRELQEVFERQYRLGAEHSYWRTDGCLACDDCSGLYNRQSGRIDSAGSRASHG